MSEGKEKSGLDDSKKTKKPTKLEIRSSKSEAVEPKKKPRKLKDRGDDIGKVTTASSSMPSPSGTLSRSFAKPATSTLTKTASKISTSSMNPISTSLDIPRMGPTAASLANTPRPSADTKKGSATTAGFEKTFAASDKSRTNLIIAAGPSSDVLRARSAKASNTGVSAKMTPAVVVSASAASSTSASASDVSKISRSSPADTVPVLMETKHTTPMAVARPSKPVTTAPKAPSAPTATIPNRTVLGTEVKKPAKAIMGISTTQPAETMGPAPPRLESPISERSTNSLGTSSLTSVVTEPPSFRIQLATDLSGNEHIYRKTKLKIDGYFAQNFVEPGECKWRTLMLYPGQGGTFGFGDGFRDENANWVTINGVEDAKASSSHIKHLLFYGRNIELIGTKDCETCVGVYFEIEGNRLFCAHINAYHRLKREPGDFLERGSAAYWEIRHRIKYQLVQQADKYGWINKHVKQDTLKLVCPYVEIAGFAVVDAIYEFLDLRDSSHVVACAHGFVITPGSRDINNEPQGKLFVYLHMGEKDGKPRAIYEDVPEEVEEVICDDHHGRNALQPWSYTASRGWDRVNRFGRLL